MGTRPSPPPPGTPIPEKVRRPHTTVSGRVVYDRRLHLFDLKDCVRILNSAQTGSDDWQVHLRFWQAVYGITERFAQRFIDLAFAWGEDVLFRVKDIYKRVCIKLLETLGQQYNTWNDRAKKAYDTVMNNIWGI